MVVDLRNVYDPPNDRGGLPLFQYRSALPNLGVESQRKSRVRTTGLALPATSFIRPSCANTTSAASSARRWCGRTRVALGRGFATMLRAKGGSRVAVGHDGRLSSPDSRARAGRGPERERASTWCGSASGPTPMLYYAEHHLEVDGGIMITGSHNPADYNGFKMVLGRQAVLRRGDPGAGPDGGGGRLGRRPRPAHRAARGHRRLRRRGWCEDFDGGRELLGSAGTPATAPPGRRSSALVARLPGEHSRCYSPTSTAASPTTIPIRPCEESRRPEDAGAPRQALDFGIAFDGDGDRIGAVDGERPGASGATSCCMILAERRCSSAMPGAHDHRRRQGQPGAVRPRSPSSAASR